MRAGGRAGLSTMPRAAGAAGAGADMDGRRSWLRGFGHWVGRGGRLRFGFFNETQCGRMQSAQLGFARFVTGELDEVAALQKFAETFLLIGQQVVRVPEFVKEFFRGAIGRMEVETFLEINADGVG